MTAALLLVGLAAATAGVMPASTPVSPSEARSGSTIPPGVSVVLRLSFAGEPVGSYLRSSLERDLHVFRWITPKLERADVVHDAAVSRNVLRVAYPRGGVGPTETGATFVADLPPDDEYYLSYRIKVDDRFDYRKGGKLPGLSSAGCRYTGGRIPVDGDGWSARMHWGPDADIGVYFYHVGMAKNYGDWVSAHTPLTKGVWHTIVQHVRLNRGRAKDGVLQVWVDGKLGLDRHDVLFRYDDQGPIAALCFSSFHGGGTPDNAPETTGHAFFDEFVVSTQGAADTATPARTGDVR